MRTLALLRINLNGIFIVLKAQNRSCIRLLTVYQLADCFSFSWIIHVLFWLVPSHIPEGIFTNHVNTFVIDNFLATLSSFSYLQKMLSHWWTEINKSLWIGNHLFSSMSWFWSILSVHVRLTVGFWRCATWCYNCFTSYYVPSNFCFIDRMKALHSHIEYLSN